MRSRQLGDVGHVAAQLRLALGQHLHQHVARLPAAGRAARVLVRVHALVGELQRGLRARGLGGDLDDPVGGGDVEALAVLGERVDRAPDDRVEAPEPAVEQQAELVAAEPVGGAAALDRAGQRAAEPREQRVARRMPERVVVGLEAVEVEEQQRAGVLVGVDQGVLEVGHQPAPVGQPAEPVGERLLVAAPQQLQVLAEREAAARHRGEQPGGGEHAGQRRQLGHPAVEQQADREQREAGGDEDAHPVAADPAAAARLPGGDAHDDDGRRPGGAEDRAGRVDAGALEVGVERVGDRGQQQAERDEAPGAARAPPGDRQRDPDRGQQQQVADRIGEVGRHGGRVPAGDLQDRPEQQGGGERGERQTADRAVQPQRGPHRPQARPQQQHETGVEEGVGGQVGGVGPVGVRRLGDVVVVHRPQEVAAGPGSQAAGHREPRSPLWADDHGPREAQRDPAEHEQVVEPVVEQRLGPGRADERLHGVHEHAEHQHRDDDAQKPLCVRCPVATGMPSAPEREGFTDRLASGPS